MTYVTFSEEELKKFSETKSSNFENSTDWKINYENITMGKEIGKGSFGVVFRAKWRHIDVAVKKLLATEVSQKQISDFLSEVEVMKKIRPHKNIVQFYGISCSPLNEVCIGKIYLFNLFYYL